MRGSFRCPKSCWLGNHLREVRLLQVRRKVAECGQVRRIHLWSKHLASQRHQVILNSQNSLPKVIIQSEHIMLVRSYPHQLRRPYIHLCLCHMQTDFCQATAGSYRSRGSPLDGFPGYCIWTGTCVLGQICKPTTLNDLRLFVTLLAKAVRACPNCYCLRRFTARRSKPIMVTISLEHPEIELSDFLERQKTNWKGDLSEFCTS